ncbi:hypothetical protein [Thermococcus peptonophilus]|uniref:hypothetical protein n=1 Tax=Thermococcus peptonophilus TaxID=53952 RepID=UPI003467E6C5
MSAETARTADRMSSSLSGLRLPPLRMSSRTRRSEKPRSRLSLAPPPSVERAAFWKGQQGEGIHREP